MVSTFEKSLEHATIPDSKGFRQAPETNKPMILNGPTSRNREVQISFNFVVQDLVQWSSALAEVCNGIETDGGLMLGGNEHPGSLKAIRAYHSFKSKSTNDPYEEMNAVNSKHWFEKTPSEHSTKQHHNMQSWLRQNNIEYDPKATKIVLYDKIKLNGKATSAVEDVECGGHSAADGGTTTRNPAVRRLLWSVLVMLSKLAVVAACAAAVWYFMGWIFVIQLVLVAVVAYLAAGGGYRWFYVAFKTAPRDLNIHCRLYTRYFQAERNYQARIKWFSQAISPQYS
ncbi:hypothetical protein ANN_00873 [Periplaneta americana]|uniref:Uncharacterized protein n=1 Tax=Periplaneta americana TaxID=6978 RepID=A0ABQ8TS47_PERAM|nr:hypothetical protein ANN_00873 [Periplaneta americana]